jgi:protein-tyrosine phosphatase
MARETSLIPANEMPEVPGLAVPGDLYWLLGGPTPLLGMARPSPKTPWALLYALGVRRVACLTDNVPAYSPAPLVFACAIELQDLYGGITPDCPSEEERKIQTAARSVVESLRAGDGVVVHCAGGTGRTGTVIGAALVALGFPANAVVAHLKAVNAKRGKTWPESPWQEDLLCRLRL